MNLFKGCNFQLYFYKNIFINHFNTKTLKIPSNKEKEKGDH